MPKFHLFILLCIAGSLLCFGCQSEGAKELRVLTFNIHHAATIEGELDPEAMAEVIKSASPDLVALQEVDVRTGRVGGVDLAARFGELCGMETYFAKAMDYDGGEYGNAILSRHPIVSGRARPLPSSDGHEPRVAAECLIAFAEDTIRFISTHFDHLAEQADRPEQARTLLRAFENETMPSILAGDLNDTIGSETLNILLQHWNLSGAPTDFTIPVETPAKKIDFVLFAPQQDWRVKHSEVLPDVVSDHLAVLTVFEFIP